MIQFEWKSASEIPTDHWEHNHAISPYYLVKCGYYDGLPIIGYARYSYATNSWMKCYDAAVPGGKVGLECFDVKEWTDIKL